MIKPVKIPVGLIGGATHYSLYLQCNDDYYDFFSKPVTLPTPKPQFDLFTLGKYRHLSKIGKRHKDRSIKCRARIKKRKAKRKPHRLARAAMVKQSRFKKNRK